MEEKIKSSSFKHSRTPRISKYEPSRASCSSIPTRTTEIEEGSTPSNPKNIKSFGVRSHTKTFTQPYYSKYRVYTQETPDMSPTYSKMINIIDQDFEINKEISRKEHRITSISIMFPIILSAGFMPSRKNFPMTSSSFLLNTGNLCTSGASQAWLICKKVSFAQLYLDLTSMGKWETPKLRSIGDNKHPGKGISHL